MAKYERGNIWDVLTPNCTKTILFITTNSTTTKDGRVVMGAGAALEAKKKYPWLPLNLGSIIETEFKNKEYNLITISLSYANEVYIGALQTKYHWRDKSPPDLVSRSIDRLSEYARSLHNYSFHCVMPGVGNGGLDFNFVKSLTTSCPDNITFWTK